MTVQDRCLHGEVQGLLLRSLCDCGLLMTGLLV